MANKYIDAEKLKAEIKIIQQSLEHRDVRFNQVKKIRTESMVELCKRIFGVIDSLQQEQLSLLDNLDKAAQESSKAVYPYEDDSHVYDRMLVNEAREYHEDGFKAGAKWMAEQGEFYEGKIQVSMRTGDLVAVATVPDEKYNFNDKVVVQIRKAE